MKSSEHKVDLLHGITPLEFLTNLSKHLGPKIYIKRDDGGSGGGGNKLRKYERLIGDALVTNCDTLIIAGHYQSNASRALVAVARQFGLIPIVVSKEFIPQQNSTFHQSGNALLMKLMDAEIVPIEKDDDYQTSMFNVAERVKKGGGKPYIIPFGGSNVLGTLGYVDCAHEIVEQFERIESEQPDYVFVATGSGGTQAGLLAGFQNKNCMSKVVGISVLHKEETIKDIVSELAKSSKTQISPDLNPQFEITIDDQFIGEGYGIPTDKGLEAIKLLARLEGLFLDPVYTSKAMSGLISYIESGRIKKEDTVVFIHTGGMPLVYAYYNKLLELD